MKGIHQGVLGHGASDGLEGLPHGLGHLVYPLACWRHRKRRRRGRRTQTLVLLDELVIAPRPSLQTLHHGDHKLGAAVALVQAATMLGHTLYAGVVGVVGGTAGGTANPLPAIGEGLEPLTRPARGLMAQFETISKVLPRVQGAVIVAWPATLPTLQSRYLQLLVRMIKGARVLHWHPNHLIERLGVSDGGEGGVVVEMGGG